MFPKADKYVYIMEAYGKLVGFLRLEFLVVIQTGTIALQLLF
jgi:hypothetical protein